MFDVPLFGHAAFGFRPFWPFRFMPYLSASRKCGNSYSTHASACVLQGALDTCARLVDESGITDVTTAVAALLKSGNILVLLL